MTDEQAIEFALGAARIDYLKFIIKTDEIEWQERYAPMFRSINDWLGMNGCTPGKVTPLGSGADGLRRYCIEYWGVTARHASEMVPHHWYNLLYRIDYREEVPVIDSDDLRAIQAYVSVRPSGRTGTSTFTTRPAKKNHQRDVGGLGVRFGSRKSDQHAVLYKRGQERTAFEFRLNGRSAQVLGRALDQLLIDNPSETRTTILLANLKAQSSRYLSKVAGVAQPEFLLQIADEAQAYMPMLFDKGNAEELAEAEAWWTGLAEDEQVEWQRQGYGPTLKGQKD